MQTHPTILLADNDELSLFILQRHFTHCCCKGLWVHCRTAEQTLTYLSCNSLPALLIIDPVMPDMHPKEFLDALQAGQVFYKTSACIVSPLFEDDIKTLTIDYAVFGRYAKPVSQQSILEMIKVSAICTPPITSGSG